MLALACLPLAFASHPGGYQPLTFFTSNTALKNAVDECYPTSGPVTGPPSATGPCATPIGDWDVSAVTDMMGLFYNISYFNEDISTWDTGAVTDMESMFYDAVSFNQDLP